MDIQLYVYSFTFTALPITFSFDGFVLLDDPVLTKNMEAFNQANSSLRVSVEWLFGDV